MLTTNDNQYGITLIEVLISMLIFSFGVLGVAKLNGSMTVSSSLAQQRTEATILAQDKIEESRAFEILDDTANTALDSFNELATDTTSDIAGTTATFTRTCTIPDATATDYKNINCTVTWTDQQGNAQSISLNSIIAGTSPISIGSVYIPSSAGSVTPP